MRCAVEKAIGLLVEAGKVDPDKDWILYKAVPRHLARAASMTENGKRKNMHPAEQIVGFRGMSADGNTPAQIGDLLGLWRASCSTHAEAGWAGSRYFWTHWRETN
uniref:hypothetical protein n=1 Tax=Serratia proteamaculans TaxID=28151 RepID=UPI001F4C0E78|nr:hypothetical protein [Serratia proteamaculans]ULG18987.1 chromosome partitioning protein ParB [Serratia proteamaculans]